MIKLSSAIVYQPTFKVDEKGTCVKILERYLYTLNITTQYGQSSRGQFRKENVCL